MRLSSLLFGSLLTCVFVASPVSAQISANQNDPLGRRAASPQACSATEASCAEAAAKIIPQVMGASPMEENLRRLTDGVGGRVSGSPEMAKAVDWAVAAFRAEGVTVHAEKYQLAHSWSEGDTRLEILDGAEKFPVRLVAAGWSPALAAGGIEANVIYVGAGTEEDFARAGANVKGGILLVSSKVGVTWADLFDEYALPPAIIERALKGGAGTAAALSAHECGRRADRCNSAGGGGARGCDASGAGGGGERREIASAICDAEQDWRARGADERDWRNSRAREAG
jgi:hypothetical protein